MTGNFVKFVSMCAGVFVAVFNPSEGKRGNASCYQEFAFISSFKTPTALL